MYPALATLQALGDDTHEILWVGSDDGMEAELIARAGITFQAVPAAGLHGIGLFSLPKNLWRIFKGIMAARVIINNFKPDVLFFTGGFVAIPTGIAGRKIPSLLFVPDIEPGKALKLITRFADRIAVSVEQSRQYFAKKEQVTVTGYPVREDMQLTKKEEAQQAFELSASLPTLLVFGGSKGARSINHALIKILPDLLNQMQIIHISGEFTWDEVRASRERLTPEQQLRYRAFPYLHERMNLALAAADLVVSRAGASVLGEFPHFGLPAILVPYPHAWHYQKQNAQYLVDRGAALIVADEELDQNLLASIQTLFSTGEELQSMRKQMSKLSQPDAAQNISKLLLDLAGEVN